MLDIAKKFYRQHAAEIYRGIASGMLMCFVFLVCCWTPSPTPRIGEKQSTVIMKYGPPDKIITTEQGPTERQRYPFVYLHYRCGFLKRSVTIITIDKVRDSVLNVTQDDGVGY